MYAHAHAHKHKMLNHVMIHIILKRTCDRWSMAQYVIIRYSIIIVVLDLYMRRVGST